MTRAIITGGGTGGLATAIALRNLDVETVVLEQAPASDPRGSAR